MPKSKTKISDFLKGTQLYIDRENLVVEAIEELIKDEIKEHILKKIKENQELHKNFKEAISLLIEAKVKEVYAYLLLAKSSADMGIDIVPQKIRNEIRLRLSKIIEEKMEEFVTEQPE